MNMHQLWVSCATLSALLLSFNSYAEQGKRYVDKKRGVSLIVPANWTDEQFPIGPLALRMEANSDEHYASCSLTVVPSNQAQHTQDWLDKSINSVPMSDLDKKNLVAQLQSESGTKLSNYYDTIQKLGNKDARTLFYNAATDSQNLSTNMYMESFYSFYVRPKDQIGITCLSGGLSQTAAHAGFEKFNTTFQKILYSVRFEGD